MLSINPAPFLIFIKQTNSFQVCCSHSPMCICSPAAKGWWLILRWPTIPLYLFPYWVSLLILISIISDFWWIASAILLGDCVTESSPDDMIWSQHPLGSSGNSKRRPPHIINKQTNYQLLCSPYSQWSEPCYRSIFVCCITYIFRVAAAAFHLLTQCWRIHPSHLYIASTLWRNINTR